MIVGFVFYTAGESILLTGSRCLSALSRSELRRAGAAKSFFYSAIRFLGFIPDPIR